MVSPGRNYQLNNRFILLFSGIKTTFSNSDGTENIPIFMSWKIALGICVAGIIVLGILLIHG